MNTYDFDETIFNPDSSYAFIIYCLKKYQGKLLKRLPAAAFAGLRYALKKTDTKQLKETLFSFLQELDDVDKTGFNFYGVYNSRRS